MEIAHVNLLKENNEKERKKRREIEREGVKQT